MNELQILQHGLHALAGIDQANFDLSAAHWQYREFGKGEFFNEYRNVCKYLGFVLDGVFRTYYIDEKTGEEKNVLFFTQHQVVSAHKSFVTQTPCNYYTQSMTASKILYIHVDQLNELYRQSHQWERIGRLISEVGFNIVMTRMESLLFRTPEERYLDLVAQHPDIFNAIPLYHISSYLGIQGPSLSRIRKRLVTQ